MKAFGIAAAAAAFLSQAVLAADVPPIVIKGNKFFYSNNGTQFYIRGVAYQQEASSTSYKDPLTSKSQCQRDIPYLTQLRTNTIRVYAINPTENHDDCMQLLQDAGIYVVADLSSPTQSIDRNDPAWNTDLFDRYKAVIDTMAQYNNTLGFFAGNEVSNQANNTDASAYVKAAVRDSKSYISEKGYRDIGVGYATNDDASIRVDMANYFNCGSDNSETIDFWGYNIYSWCGDSSYTTSGYDVRTEEFANYSVPVFFAEYGCNAVTPRKFTDTPVLFGPKMNDVWSGGIVYMYFQEANDYGLVTVSGNSVSTLSDFSYYSKQIATVSPTGVNSASFTPTNTANQACPTVGEAWGAKSSPLPPTPNDNLCECMYKSLSCVISPNVDSANYGDLFGTVCGLNSKACDGISTNATTGVYGAYSVCNTTYQLAFALNRYYELGNSQSSACAFSGSATLTSSAKATGTCSSLLNAAGTAGTGTVAAAATGGAAGVSGSSASGTKSPGAGTPGAPMASVNFGILQVGIYAITAIVTGVGMIML